MMFSDSLSRLEKGFLYEQVGWNLLDSIDATYVSNPKEFSLWIRYTGTGHDLKIYGYKAEFKYTSKPIYHSWFLRDWLSRDADIFVTNNIWHVPAEDRELLKQRGKKLMDHFQFFWYVQKLCKKGNKCNLNTARKCNLNLVLFSIKMNECNLSRFFLDRTCSDNLLSYLIKRGDLMKKKKNRYEIAGEFYDELSESIRQIKNDIYSGRIGIPHICLKGNGRKRWEYKTWNSYPLPNDCRDCFEFKKCWEIIGFRAQQKRINTNLKSICSKKYQPRQLTLEDRTIEDALWKEIYNYAEEMALSFDEILKCLRKRNTLEKLFEQGELEQDYSYFSTIPTN